MIEGFIEFNHEHLQVPNMNGFLFIFNKQLLVSPCTQDLEDKESLSYFYTQRKQSNSQSTNNINTLKTCLSSVLGTSSLSQQQNVTFIVFNFHHEYYTTHQKMHYPQFVDKMHYQQIVDSLQLRPCVKLSVMVCSLPCIHHSI